MDKSIKQMTKSEIDAEIKVTKEELKSTPNECNKYRMMMLQDARNKRKSS